MTDTQPITVTFGEIVLHQPSSLNSPLPESGEGKGSRSEPRGEGRSTYLARFVRAGRPRTAANSPASIVITPEALQAAVDYGFFENRAVFLDHAGMFDYPSLRNLIGVTADVEYNAADQAVDGRILLNDTPSADIAREIIESFLSDPASAPDIGLSIVFYPQSKHDPDGNTTVIGFKHVESVDLVFQPAMVDARILQKLSAIHQKGDPTPMSTPEITAPVITEPAPAVQPAAQPPASSDAAAWSAAADQAAIAAARQQLINASGLPEAARTRLASGSYATPEELQRAINTEQSYIAELQRASVVQIGGHAPRAGGVSGMLSSLDRIEIALEALINGTRPANGVQPLTGIRELYNLLSGDYEMSGVFQPERIQFANVSCSTMANMVANALNKSVVVEFAQYPKWWEPIAINMDYPNLQPPKWIMLGGVGELPTVNEGSAYTELTWDDSYETATFVKKGGYLGITMEAIDKDDTGRLMSAPRALAQAAWLTLSKAVSTIFTTASGAGPNLVDGTALFAVGRGNLGTTALSMTTWEAAKLAMRKFTELNSSERLGALVSPKFLLVPPDLETTALQILATPVDYTYALSNGVAPPTNVNASGLGLDAQLAYARSRVIVVDLWTDANNWAAVADPKLWPTIGIGYRYGRVPEIYAVTSPTQGLMFTNDTMPVKVRFMFATGPMDWRGMYKANVA